MDDNYKYQESKRDINIGIYKVYRNINEEDQYAICCSKMSFNENDYNK